MKHLKRAVALLLVCVLLLGVMPTALAAEGASSEIVYTDTTVTYQGVTFQRETEGTYAGLPLFDAEPDHLNAYLDVYMDYIGLDGMVRIALEKRSDYTLVDTYTFSASYGDANLAGKTITWDQPNAGKVIPGSPKFSSPEGVQGVSTNFPAQIGVGQTWNTDLVAQEGNVVGTEKLYKDSSTLTDKSGSYLSNANQMVSTALTDIRSNPLSGRIDEGYAEDPYLAGVMANAMAAGVTGHDQDESDDGFWQMAFVDTKHFTNYLAQWQRNSGSFYNSARGLLEYVARSAFEGFSNDNFGCFMTSYGTTNYVPNGMSPLIAYVKNLSNYPISTINDNGAETAPQSRLGNDFMTSYWTLRVEQILAQALANASAGYQQSTADAKCDDIYATVYAIQSGKLGVTEADFVEQAKGAIINQIRGGLLNERDENGQVKDFPFADIYTSGTVYDYTNTDHQNVSLAMAQESAVLLKNNGVLPLDKDADVVVAGQVADARFTTTYAGTTYAGENMGLTPLGGIMEAVGAETAEDVHYATGVEQIKLQVNGAYLKIDASGNLGTQVDGDVAVFNLYAWGQDDSISLQETTTGKWLTYSAGGRGQTQGISLAADSLHLGASAASNGSVGKSSMPGNMRREYVDESANSFRLLANTFTGGFFNEFEESYYTEAVYLCVDETGSISYKEPAGSVENVDAVRTADTVFTAEVVNDVAADIYTEGDAAIVVVGVSPTFSAGEGTDRVDLDLGAEQYELCHAVAAQYPGKTVVVVKVSSPVDLQPLEDDGNIGAILYQPYAGQYEGLALGQLLFGDAEPSGRLVNTWYSSTEVLPDIDQSIIYNGWEKDGVTLDDLDPARDVLMTNGDPYDTGLTYMYLDEADKDAYVTYEFGYGLSYGEVEYRSISAPSTVNADGTFTVTVEVANLGQTPTTEVVELYIAAKNSPYGDAAPEKQLVAFDKITVPAATSAFATLTVDPQDFAVYTATEQDLTVLSGSYTLMAGRSSENIQQTKTITVNGESLGVLDASGRTDVFASAFAADDVYYREYSRQSTIDSLKADSVTDGYYTVVSKNSGAWVAVANVNLSGLESLTLEAAAKTAGGDIEIRLGSPDGQLIGTATVPVTDATTYVLENSDAGDFTGTEITELAFTEVEAALQDVSGLGNETIYFVFKAPELRLASFSAETGAPATVAVTGVELSDETLTLEVEESAALTASVQPENATNQHVSWSSSDAAVASVDENGKVTAHKAGTAVITVTTEDGEYTASCTVIVAEEEEPEDPDDGGHRPPVIIVPVEPDDTTPDYDLPFTDVPEGAWYYDSVYSAWENGLIDGVTADKYKPDGSLTVAQAIKLAAALHQMMHQGYVTLENGTANWYDTYVTYAVNNDIIEAKYQTYTKAQMDTAISRSEFVHIFYGALDTCPEINTVADNAIPDVKMTDTYADEIYAFYRAGILTGSDGQGTFLPGSSIKRSEVATILIRMYDESVRESITLR